MPDLFDALGVGARVVARYELQDGTLTDALGTIEYIGPPASTATPPSPRDAEPTAESGPRIVIIKTKRGDVTIPTHRITHAKPVPPPPERRAPRVRGD